MSMEVLFSNHCILDEAAYGDIYGIYTKRIRIYVLGLLAGAYGIYMMVRFYKVWYLALIGFLLVIEILFLIFFSSKLRGKKLFKRSCELYQSDHIEIETLFMDNGFETINPVTGGRLMIEYSQIKSCRELHDKYLIILKARQFLCMNKYGFIVGHYVEFQDFLIDKCPGAKIKFKDKKK